jgi:GST-like protein
MIELYYWPTPNGHKISIALEEMGLSYEVKPVNIGARDQFKPEFLTFSPNNRMPANERIAVYEWLMWQMGGFGPMLGQAHHFNYYAPEKVDYAMKRYSAEANRLYGVLDRRLAITKYVAGGTYSIADIAILPWTRTYQRQNVVIEDYPHVAAWREDLGSREAVVAGMKVGAQWREDLKTLNSEDFAKLFGIK